MIGHDYAVAASTVVFRGGVITVRQDRVSMPGGGEQLRDVVQHPGAVGVVALDETAQVLLVEQYRHPAGRRLWELPAGLLDVAGESAVAAAARELVEEAGLAAGRWDVLLDMLTSPGMSDEAVRVFLARDLSARAQEPGRDEEAELRTARVPLDEAVRQVLAGEIENAMACTGLLAAFAWQAGARELRPADAPWPARPDRAGCRPGQKDET
ncbi:MAG: NUDIX domain-containing protein [Mycobacteriales bacterium]